MVAWRTGFEGPDGALGLTDEGLPFTLMRGSVARRAGTGYAQPTSPGPFAVVDAGLGGADGTLRSTFANPLGQALYFRVAGLNDWSRAGVRGFSYSYASGTQTVVIGYDRVQTGTVRRTVFYNYYDYSPPYQVNGLLRTGSYDVDEPVYEDRPVYGQQTTYATATDYLLVLEECVAGRVTEARRLNLGSATGSELVVTLADKTIGVRLDGKALEPFTTAQAQEATSHGFGYLETHQLGGYVGADAVTFTPTASGLYTPTAML